AMRAVSRPVAVGRVLVGGVVLLGRQQLAVVPLLELDVVRAGEGGRGFYHLFRDLHLALVIAANLGDDLWGFHQATSLAGNTGAAEMAAAGSIRNMKRETRCARTPSKRPRSRAKRSILPLISASPISGKRCAWYSALFQCPLRARLMRLTAARPAAFTRARSALPGFGGCMAAGMRSMMSMARSTASGPVVATRWRSNSVRRTSSSTGPRRPFRIAVASSRTSSSVNASWLRPLGSL